MKTYLKNIANQLKNFSLSLDKESILIDKPWAMIDEEFEMQKLIFRKNKELIMSKNGKVSIGNWDYLVEAKSILIDRGNDKILFNESFVDQGVLILKLDGTIDKYFALANENKIPNLDVISYLKKIRDNKLNIVRKSLDDGTIIEIQRLESYAEITNGNPVYIDSNQIEDGIYPLKSENRKIVVRNGRIKDFLYEKKYKTTDGIELIINSNKKGDIFEGDEVTINGEKAPDGKYKIGFLKTIKTKDGKCC